MRRQIALLVAATASLVLVAFLVPLALLVQSVAAHRAVSAATVEAQSLASLVASVDRATLSLSIQQVNGSARHPVTVFLPDGAVLGAPAARSASVRLAAAGRSITADVPGGREVLVAVQGLPAGTAVIRTFVPGDELRQGVTRAWVILASLGVGLLALGVLVADRLARGFVRPIGELATVSHRLAAGDLAARARSGEGPPEVRDVARALNHLARRIRDLLAEEREAVADISHRLRTPLTALRLEAETLRDPEEAARMGAGVDRLERAVTEVINQARRHGAAAPQVCDAVTVIGERVAFWAVLAEDQDRALRVDLTAGPIAVRLGRDELTACVDALLGNVFAHTPEGTSFTVRLARRDDGGARLVVADEGPGFGELSSARALRRGASGADSTGLGLDIARRAAESSGGSLTLDSAPGGGAEVCVELGPADEPDPA